MKLRCASQSLSYAATDPVHRFNLKSGRSLGSVGSKLALTAPGGPRLGVGIAARGYMTVTDFHLLPDRIKALSASMVHPVQKESYCHLATGRNLEALRDPDMRDMDIAAGHFVGNEAAINKALDAGNVVHVRGVGGLATRHSIYLYDCSHSILLLGRVDGHYIAYDPDHTQHPVTRESIEGQAADQMASPEEMRPEPHLMLRKIRPETLSNIYPEVRGSDKLPIVYGDIPDLQ